MIGSDIQKLTLYLNQGSDTALTEIKDALVRILHGDAFNPMVIRQSMCVAASVYIDLKLNGAKVGSFADYYVAQVADGTIRANDAYCFDMNRIVESYGYKRKRIDNFADFSMFLLAGLYEHGTVRTTQGGGHTMNWYTEDKKVYVSDVGHASNHGKLLNTAVNKDNFKYAEYIFRGKS
jgi:hypothetical protein